MPIYQARTRAKTRRRTTQFFSFPPFSHPASPSTCSSTFFLYSGEFKFKNLNLIKLLGSIKFANRTVDSLIR